VVVNVLKIDHRLARKDRLLAPQQRVEDVAQGNYGATQEDQLLFYSEDVVQRFGLKVLEYLRLKLVKTVGKIIEHRHVIIDDRVQ
jgi:hypothetical protein